MHNEITADLDLIPLAVLNQEIADDLTRKGVQVRPVETRVDLTTQIASESAVAHHLGTDLTRERAARNHGDADAWTFRWEGCTGGTHRVRATSRGVHRTFFVDLVTGEVA
jgi:hypothetical protein